MRQRSRSGSDGDTPADGALWQFDPVDPEANLSLAGFVAQSDWFVDEIVGAAFSRFRRYSAGRFANYQSAVDSEEPTVLRLVPRTGAGPR